MSVYCTASVGRRPLHTAPVAVNPASWTNSDQLDALLERLDIRETDDLEAGPADTSALHSPATSDLQLHLVCTWGCKQTIALIFCALAFPLFWSY